MAGLYEIFMASLLLPNFGDDSLWMKVVRRPVVVTITVKSDVRQLSCDE